MKLSLTNRILLPTLIITTIGILGLTALSYYQIRKMTLTNAKNDISSMVSSTSNIMEMWVKDRTSDLETWAGQKIYQVSCQESFVGQSARASANVELSKLLVRYPVYEVLSIVSSNGMVVVSSETNNIGKVNVSDRDYFQKAMAGASVLSDVVMSKSSGKPVFVIASPIKEGERAIGLVLAVVDLNSYSQKFILNRKLGNEGNIFLCNKQGMIVAHKNKDLIFKEDISKSSGMSDLLSLGNGSYVRTVAGEEMVVVVQSLPSLNWFLLGSIPNSELLEPIRKVSRTNALLALLLIAGVGALLVWLMRSVINPINQIMLTLGNTSRLVNDEANQISSASQSLAEGASEQASSLEESSAALEEMASIAQLNDEHAQSARDLACQTCSAADHSANDMQEMNQAMCAIQTASQRISKIIKTIDEIAFQTNILALNAAVEAARAGQAGAGFAVVADEVRTLAQRSAQAAHETADRIEEAMKTSTDGVRISEKVSLSLREMVDKVKMVSDLIAQIANASKEQHTGTVQVNTAVSQMDKVTQSNAAHAEECASASQELSSRASELQDIVFQLEALVGTQTNAADKQPARAATSPPVHNKRVTNPVKEEAEVTASTDEASRRW